MSTGVHFRAVEHAAERLTTVRGALTFARDAHAFLDPNGSFVLAVRRGVADEYTTLANARRVIELRGLPFVAAMGGSPFIGNGWSQIRLYPKAELSGAMPQFAVDRFNEEFAAPEWIEASTFAAKAAEKATTKRGRVAQAKPAQRTIDGFDPAALEAASEIVQPTRRGDRGAHPAPIDIGKAQLLRRGGVAKLKIAQHLGVGTEALNRAFEEFGEG